MRLLTSYIRSKLIVYIAAAEQRELYRFSADLGKLALRIAERHGSTGEKWYATFPLLLLL